jgi:glycosyltransferase involved in cell wall biosynthesis
LSAGLAVDYGRLVHRGNIGWLFGLGHGHYAQFLNFQECFPEDRAERAHWIGLEYGSSGDTLSRIPLLPTGLRTRRNVLWQVRTGLAQLATWDALFFSVEQSNLHSTMASHRSYLYIDLTPSLKRQLAPWYDHQLSRHALVDHLRTAYRRRCYDAARGVFTMSEWAAAGVRSDYDVPLDRVHVTLPGANLKRWRFVDRRARSGHNPVRILMVGGEFLRKGGGMLLDWAEATDQSGWELDIVTWPGDLPTWVQGCLGQPSPNERVSAVLAPRLPNVRVHCGLRANSAELMSLFEAADVFCLPTMADGSSIASLEAMATGLPVLVGAVGGIPELIEDGVTGFLLAPGDPADLADKLHAVLDNATLRCRVGMAARRSCEERFNVERQLGEILTIIDREG